MRSAVSILIQFCVLYILHSQVDCLPRGNQIQERFHQYRVSKKALFASRPVNPLEIYDKHLLPLWSTNRKTVLSLILSTAYMSIVLSVMSLPVCLTAIYADSSFYSDSIKGSLLSKIVSAGNVSNMIGKFVLGPPTDSFGGEQVLFLTLLLSAAFLFGCSISQGIKVFGIYWILFSFVFSAAWGAIGRIIRENFSEKEWAVQLGLVYTGSRLGSILSVLFFGSILRSPSLLSGSIPSNWRSVFRTSSTVLISVLAVSSVVMKLLSSTHGRIKLTETTSKSYDALDSTTENKLSNSIDSEEEASDRQIVLPAAKPTSPERKENISQILSRLVKEEFFWMVLASKVSFVSVRQFSTFFPFYLATGYSMKPSSATFASATFAFGSLISSTLGAKLYQALSSMSQMRLISFCNFWGFIIPGLLWAHHSSYFILKNFYLPQKVVLLIISLWGVFWALPFGPSGALVLSLGGVNHVALLVNLFDAVGLFFASILSYYALEYGKVGNWGPILLSLSLTAAVAYASMARAMTLQMEWNRIS